MMKYLTNEKKVTQEFKKCNIEQIPQSQNMHANALSKLASAYPSQIDRTVYFEMKEKLSIAKGTEIM